LEACEAYHPHRKVKPRPFGHCIWQATNGEPEKTDVGGSDSYHHRDYSQKRKTEFSKIPIIPQQHPSSCGFPSHPT